MKKNTADRWSHDAWLTVNNGRLDGGQQLLVEGPEVGRRTTPLPSQQHISFLYVYISENIIAD